MLTKFCSVPWPLKMALRESEERFRSTFEQAAVGNRACCARWTLAPCQPEALRDNRIPAEELSKLNFQRITHPMILPPMSG